MDFTDLVISPIGDQCQLEFANDFVIDEVPVGYTEAVTCDCSEFISSPPTSLGNTVSYEDTDTLTPNQLEPISFDRMVPNTSDDLLQDVMTPTTKELVTQALNAVGGDLTLSGSHTNVGQTPYYDVLGLFPVPTDNYGDVWMSENGVANVTCDPQHEAFHHSTVQIPPEQTSKKRKIEEISPPKAPSLPDGEKAITIDELRKVFHLPEKTAAQTLGVKPLVLRKAFRKYFSSSTPWPYQKIKNIDVRIQKYEQMMALFAANKPVHGGEEVKLCINNNPALTPSRIAKKLEDLRQERNHVIAMSADTLPGQKVNTQASTAPRPNTNLVTKLEFFVEPKKKPEITFVSAPNTFDGRKGKDSPRTPKQSPKGKESPRVTPIGKRSPKMQPSSTVLNLEQDHVVPSMPPLDLNEFCLEPVGMPTGMNTSAAAAAAPSQLIDIDSAAHQYQQQQQQQSVPPTLHQEQPKPAGRPQAKVKLVINQGVATIPSIGSLGDIASSLNAVASVISDDPSNNNHNNTTLLAQFELVRDFIAKVLQQARQT